MMGKPKDEETYSRRWSTDPDFILTQLRLYLADALQAQNRLDEAAQEYRQVLAIEPDNYYAFNNLGIIFEKQGLTQEALKEFRLSLAIKPDQAMAHFKIGRIFMQIASVSPKQ